MEPTEFRGQWLHHVLWLYLNRQAGALGGVLSLSYCGHCASSATQLRSPPSAWLYPLSLSFPPRSLSSKCSTSPPFLSSRTSSHTEMELQTQQRGQNPQQVAQG